MINGSNDLDHHLAHFLFAHSDTVHNGSLMLWQFVLSLKGVASDWYSRLAPALIPDWQMMKQAFLTHFYNARRCVSLRELNEIDQGRDEPAAEFINRLHVLNFTTHRR